MTKWVSGDVELYCGDCLEAMPLLAADSIDSIVTDSPYGLSFMGKDWDNGVPGIHFWTEALRVAKPGAHLLAFGGTRTFHRLACAIEDAGWEIRDCVMWVYGSGFPKSLDVSKAIDKAAGAEREVIADNKHADRYPNGPGGVGFHGGPGEYSQNSRPPEPLTSPSTPAAKQWAGWGTALKPAWEPIIVARKPLTGTVAENVQKWGTGAINIDGCRVKYQGDYRSPARTSGEVNSGGIFGAGIKPFDDAIAESKGRWPANLVHDGSEEVVRLFPQTAPSTVHERGKEYTGCFGGSCDTGPTPKDGTDGIRGVADTGSAARFFYCAKASRADRDEGCEGMEEKELQAYGDFTGTPEHGAKNNVLVRNNHPTVKHTALMRYLCRLVTPPHGIILDPFAGSGSTGKAAVLEGFRFCGVELEQPYFEIACKRIIAAQNDAPLFDKPTTQLTIERTV